MARLVLVRDLQAPLGPQLDAEQSASDASDTLNEASVEQGYDPMARISIVVRKRNIIGWTGFDMLVADKKVCECIDPIQASSVLSADTTALEAVEIFGSTSHHFFFVLHHNRVTGTLHYGDLFSLPVKLCLFALTLDLEDSALRLALIWARDSWQCLTEERRKRGEAVYELRYKHSPHSEGGPYDQLLGCTTFCDKGNILKKCGLVPEISGKKIDSIFSRAERVRNSCAHTNPDNTGNMALVERADLCQFIEEIQRAIGLIESMLETPPHRK